MRCKNCGTENNERNKFCESCGAANNGGECGRSIVNPNEIVPPISNKGKRITKIIFALVIVAGIALISYFGYYLYEKYFLPSINSSLPSLANFEFPSEQSQYPEGWPPELKFPEEFMLVDSSSGTVPEGLTKGWALKLRYEGKPSEAEKKIATLFEDKGWAIVKNEPLDSGGFSLLIQRNQGSGIVVIDTDPNHPSKALIIATIFP